MDYFSKLPDSLIAKIIQIGQTDTDVSWAYGNATIEVQAHLLASGLDASLLECARFVYRTSGETRSLQSIYRYAMVAKFYADKNIDYYLSYPIPFSHFAYAVRYHSNWASVLDYCLDFLEKEGYPPSVNKLDEHFNPNHQVNLFVPESITPPEKNISFNEETKIIDEISDNDYYAEEAIIEAIRKFDGILSNSIDNIRVNNPKLAQALSAILVLCKNIIENYQYWHFRSMKHTVSV